MKTYFVKTFEQHPFTVDLHDLPILCDVETNEPFAQIENDLGWIRDGEVFTEEEMTISSYSKRHKFIQVGDYVVLGLFDSLVGKVDEIIYEDQEGYSYEDKLKIIDIKMLSSRPGWEYNGPAEETIMRKDCIAKPYNIASIIITEDRFKKDYCDFIKTGTVSIDEQFEWLMKRVKIKKYGE